MNGGQRRRRGGRQPRRKWGGRGGGGAEGRSCAPSLSLRGGPKSGGCTGRCSCRGQFDGTLISRKKNVGTRSGAGADDGGSEEGSTVREGWRRLPQSVWVEEHVMGSQRCPRRSGRKRGWEWALVPMAKSRERTGDVRTTNSNGEARIAGSEDSTDRKTAIDEPARRQMRSRKRQHSGRPPAEGGWGRRVQLCDVVEKACCSDRNMPSQSKYGGNLWFQPLVRVVPLE